MTYYHLWPVGIIILYESRIMFIHHIHGDKMLFKTNNCFVSRSVDHKILSASQLWVCSTRFCLAHRYTKLVVVFVYIRVQGRLLLCSTVKMLVLTTSAEKTTRFERKLRKKEENLHFNTHVVR